MWYPFRGTVSRALMQDMDARSTPLPASAVPTVCQERELIGIYVRSLGASVSTDSSVETPSQSVDLCMMAKATNICFMEIKPDSVKLAMDVTCLLTPPPPMGPFPVEDTIGMGVVMTMLIRSLDAGSNERTIQYLTMRRLRSAHSNIYNASSSLSNVAVIA